MAIRYPGPYPSWDLRKILDAWKCPKDDLISICAHRGASHDGGTENSYNAFAKAAQLGWESVEIDLRLTKDGKVAVFHDERLGRLTDIKTPEGQMPFNPFTAQGYSPKLCDFEWKQLKELHLRDGYGRVT